MTTSSEWVQRAEQAWEQAVPPHGLNFADDRAIQLAAVAALIAIAKRMPAQQPGAWS